MVYAMDPNNSVIKRLLGVFLFGYNMIIYLFALHPGNSVIKELWCIVFVNSEAPCR